jgi:guanosine-3',5'-bis(diphosphate) 3'-pyrophosphohydrolase
VSEARPAFITGPGLAAEAYEFAARAHEGQDRKGDGSPYIRHPVEVARLLHREGVDDEVTMAAAFLHDVVEDSDTTLDEIRDSFGDEVTAIVEAMTEDKSIEPYKERKEHHREQVAAFGAGAARIYAADKLANLRDMRTLYASEGEAAAAKFKAPIDVRVDLWRGDLELAERMVPELGLVAELRSELDAFDAERASTVRA